MYIHIFGTRPREETSAEPRWMHALGLARPPAARSAGRRPREVKARPISLHLPLPLSLSLSISLSLSLSLSLSPSLSLSLSL